MPACDSAALWSAHFDNAAVPPTLVRVADVITVEPEYIYARWANGQLPAELGGDGEKGDD
ncbi:hypothetical protein [Nocardia nova]|uniref:hypothetical protein n=1 Tax=Nocardia nova TaxID=37330 RepID=UPI00215861AA|nr:hypothetical protein [Nocardia nova]